MAGTVSPACYWASRWRARSRLLIRCSCIRSITAVIFQDDYRVTSRLTLNLGIRYEFTTPYAEKFGQIGYFDPAGTEAVTGLKGEFRLTKPGGYQENPQYTNFEPRMGIA